MNKIVEVRNLSFSYEKQTVLKDINITIQEGDFIAFVGPNGSGKSTLMKLMIGDLKPDRGEISLFGRDINNFNEWSRIGYMSQQVRDFNQSFPATVREVIAANLYQEMGLFKVLNKGLEKKIDRVLDLVDMVKYGNRQIGNLSGGQQQRVFIARTLVTEPELIFLDEPMVGIDSSAQDDFIRLINRLNRVLNITVVMVSHDLHVISSQANKIAFFNRQNILIYNSDDFDYELYLNRINPLPEHEHSIGGDNNA